MGGSRVRRLENDHKSMEKLRLLSSLIDFTAYGLPPEKYVITFRCKGLIWKNGCPVFSSNHQVELYMGNEYPTQQPHLKWLTPIFHPNILGSDNQYYPGKVCLGKWAPSMFLSDLCIKLAEMIQYKNYDIQSPLNINAAVWANENKHLLPIDKRDLLKPEADTEFDECKDEIDVQILE